VAIAIGRATVGTEKIVVSVSVVVVVVLGRRAPQEKLVFGVDSTISKVSLCCVSLFCLVIIFHFGELIVFSKLRLMCSDIKATSDIVHFLHGISKNESDLSGAYQKTKMFKNRTK